MESGQWHSVTDVWMKLCCGEVCIGNHFIGLSPAMEHTSALIVAVSAYHYTEGMAYGRSCNKHYPTYKFVCGLWQSATSFADTSSVCSGPLSEVIPVNNFNSALEWLTSYKQYMLLTNTGFSTMNDSGMLSSRSLAGSSTCMGSSFSTCKERWKRREMIEWWTGKWRGEGSFLHRKWRG